MAQLNRDSIRSQTSPRKRGATKNSDAVTPAFLQKLSKQLLQETEPMISPGLEREIESDFTGRGGNAFARRLGIAYLTQPFRTTAAAWSNPESADTLIEMAERVNAAADAHREVARLLDMAHARMLAAISNIRPGTHTVTLHGPGY